MRACIYIYIYIYMRVRRLILIEKKIYVCIVQVILMIINVKLMSVEICKLLLIAQISLLIDHRYGL